MSAVGCGNDFNQLSRAVLHKTISHQGIGPDKNRNCFQTLGLLYIHRNPRNVLVTIPYRDNHRMRSSESLYSEKLCCHSAGLAVIAGDVWNIAEP